jgi:PhzF family phenazine biosynthesis protein
MSIPVLQIDAFTELPYRGNPAAVCLLAGPADEGWMQAVAREMNLSETAFLVPDADHYRLRWFTPIAEVDLCGHATLASAHALWETGRVPGGAAIDFDTRSGRLSARQAAGGIVLDFPASPVTPIDTPPELSVALGVEATFVGRTLFDYFVVVADAAAVRGLAPDFTRLRALPVRGIIVTSRSDDPRCDIVSRFFGPAVGVDEDPVTGSAHCALGPYWGAILGQDSLVAYQASPRGGRLQVTVQGDRVLLTGQAVTILRGELLHGPGAGTRLHYPPA